MTVTKGTFAVRMHPGIRKLPASRMFYLFALQGSKISGCDSRPETLRSPGCSLARGARCSSGAELRGATRISWCRVIYILARHADLRLATSL